MIARSRRLALRAAGHYRDAFREFSPNARRWLLAYALQSLALGILMTMFGLYVKSAGLSETVVGDVEAAIALATLVVCLAVPALVSGVGYRRLLLVSAAAYAVARFGQAAVPAATPMLAFGLVDGIGEGVIASTTFAFLSENSGPKERPFLFSIDLVVRVLAGFVGGLVGGLLPVALGFAGETDAYRLTVALAAAVYALSAVPLLGIREQAPASRRALARYLVTVRRFRSWDHVGRLLVTQVVIAFGAGLIMPFVSLYLRHELGATLPQVGLVQGVSQLAMGAAALTAPFVARRLGLVRGLVAAEALSLPLLIAIPFVRDLRVAALLFWGRTALMNMSNPLFGQYSMEAVAPREKPLVASTVALGWAVGWLGGSMLGGRLAASSYTQPYFIAAVFYVTGVLATWWLLEERPAEGVAAVAAATDTPE